MNKPPFTYEDLIRGYNQSWWHLYYEELIDDDTYQMTLLKCAGESFYNCVHLFAFPAQDDLQKITSFFAEYGLTPTMYIEESLYKAHSVGLTELEYLPTPADENEIWWTIEKKNYVPQPCTRTLRVRKVAISDSMELSRFLAVDAKANNLNNDIVGQLRQHLTMHYDKNVVLFLAKTNSGDDVACGAIVKVGDTAFLSEGGVLPSHRRQGLHTAIVNARLNVAFNEWKCSTCVCVTTQNALSVHTLKKTGFTNFFSRIMLKQHPKAEH